MRIAIIGRGRLGGTAARLFAQAGHDADAAVSDADVVLVAIPFERFRELPAEALAGKVVIDAMNHFPGGGDGRLALFLAGDDEDAKLAVSRLIDDIGFAPVDTGGRRQQPGSPLFAELGRRRRAGLDPPGVTAREARRLWLRAA